MFLLGGLQGFIGWWMVASGLEYATSVSQYRLAIHLGTALLLLAPYCGSRWNICAPPRRPTRKTKNSKAPGCPNAPLAFAGLVYFQMLLGALVAGLHAGLIYNTWPDMNGRLLPEDPFFSRPWWINFFENPGLAQFDHRIGAYLVAAFAAWIYVAGHQACGHARISAKLVAIITTFQIALGITTLLLQAPEWLAAAHQVTAACLLCAAVWHGFELRVYPNASKSSA